MTDDPTPPPPIGKSWNRIYAVVLIVLAVEVVIFYVFTKAFQ